MIPDEAIDDMNEVSKTAFAIYAYLCRRRNRKTGVCFPSLRRVAEDCQINYCYASEMRKELVCAGWLEMDDKGHFRPLKGFGNSKVREVKTPLENPNTEFGNSKHSEKESLEIPKKSLEIPKGEFGNSKTTYIGINQHIEPVKITRERGRADARTTRAGTRLPDAFEITQNMRDWASVKAPLVDLSIEHEKFENYYRSVPGGRGLKLDWAATWRNWMLKAIKEYDTNGTNKGNGRHQREGTADRLRGYEAVFDKYR